MPGLARRLANRFAAPYTREIADRVAEVKGDTERIERRLDELHVQLQGAVETAHADVVKATERSVDGLRAEFVAESVAEFEAARGEFAKVHRMLRHIDDEAAANRRRLYALRESEEYELAFTEAEPLVSYVIPTYDRYESLRDVSLPSILAQTYPHLEVLVSGDHSPPETEAVVREIGDERVRFLDRTVRGPYPEDRSQRWYMIGTPPYNDAVAAARGRWIATLGDDDAVVPHHAETLLAAARADRLEHVYGRHRVHYPSGELLEVGAFPPRKGEFVLQSSLYHAGLSFFGMPWSDHLYEDPNDWSLCRRMLDAGVRFGMVEAFLAEKYERRYQKHDDWGTYGVPSVD